MGDPLERRSEKGMIETGAAASRIRMPFTAAVDRSVAAIRQASPDCSVYVYGSVATGEARVGSSDLDLLTIGFDEAGAAALSARLSIEHAQLCRSVEIAPAGPNDLEGEDDEAYGFRVFLRHYCVLLAGADHRPDHDFPADVRAARGFNGDIAQHRDRWCRDLDLGADPALLGPRLARKTLLAVAGLVSVHDVTWTTDRGIASSRWSEIDPQLGSGLERLLAWVGADVAPASAEVERALRHVVGPIVDRFADDIGVWPDGTVR